MAAVERMKERGKGPEGCEGGVSVSGGESGSVMEKTLPDPGRSGRVSK